MPIADLLKSLYREQGQPEEEKSLLEKMGLGIFTPEAYYKKMKGMVDIVSDYGKRAIEAKLREDTEFMKDYVTAYTPTLPEKERQEAGQRIKKRYYSTIESMYAAQTMGRLGKFVTEKVKLIATAKKWTPQNINDLANKMAGMPGYGEWTPSDESAYAFLQKTAVKRKISVAKLLNILMKSKKGIRIPATPTKPAYGGKLPSPISDKTYELKKILTKPSKPIISEKAVTKPEPSIPPKPKPLTPEEIEIIRHPPGRIVKEPIKVTPTPTPVPPAPGIEKVITPYVPKKPVVKPTLPIPEEPVTEYAGTAFGEPAAPPTIRGVGLGKKSPLDVYYPGIGPPSGMLPAKVPRIPKFEHPIYYYVNSNVVNKFASVKQFTEAIEKARTVFVEDKALDELSNFNIEEEFGSLENYYNWVKINTQNISRAISIYDEFIDKLPVDSKTKALWKKDPENLELNLRTWQETRPPAKVPELPERVVTDVKVAQSQLTEAHKIAKDKLLITETGKLKSQYRRLAFNMTGKKSMTQMTYEEAETFIDALKKVSEPRYLKGKVMPPIIPVSKKLVTPDFFKQMKFKEPTLAKYLTSQMYYAERLGVKPLVGGMEIGKQKFDLEFTNLSHDVDKMGKVINKLGKASIWQRIGKKIKNLPTHPIARMRNILDRYEEPPAFLSDDDKSVFRYFRNLNRTIRLRSNEVRKGLGLEPILYRKAYVRHIAEGTAREMLLGQYPFPEGLKYWSKEVVGRKIFNPMAFHRKLVDDLERLWTRDLIHATKSMLWTGLKEIHMGQPLRYLNEALGVVSRDKSTYKLLSPEQRAIQDAQQVIPASTKKWLIDYVNQAMKGQETGFDASVNRIVTNTGIGGLFNKILAPFGRTIGRHPVTKVFQVSGRMVIHGVMGLLRPKQLIRNKFQLIQNLALYGVRSTLRGLLPSTPTMKKLITNSLFMKTYTGAEELPLGIQHKLEKANLAPFQWTAISNARQAMKSAYWDTHDLITNPKYRRLGWADPKRTYREKKDFLYPGEREKIIKEMEFGAGVTQYHYIPLGMPQVFRFKALVPFTRLQSWWMNYYFKFNREAINRAFKGETGYGMKLPWSRRINYFKYLIIGGAILNTLGYERSFLFGTAPTYLPPPAQLMIGLYTYAVNFTPKTKWDKSKKKQAEYQIFNALKTFIPGYLSYKDFKALISGEKPIESLFFYTKIGKGGKHKLGYISEIAETIGLKEKVYRPPKGKTISEKLKELYK